MPKKNIIILQHNISYHLDDGAEIEDGDCEHEHIVYSINQGFSEGELCRCHGLGKDCPEVRGYWSIVRGN
jgi:hypothetical protein